MKNILLALLLLGAASAPPARDQASSTPAPVPPDVPQVQPADAAPIDVYDGFENPALGRLWATWRLAEGAVQMQSAIVRAGHGAARITLHPRDVLEAGKNADHATERDELAEAEELYSREDRSYEFSWSMYLPPDFPIVPVRLVVAQWKQKAANESAPAFDDSPVLAVRYTSGVLRITQDRDRRPRAVLYQETRDLRGHWLGLRFQVRLTPESTGFVRAWLDGRQVVDYRGPTANMETPGTGYASPSRYYFKMGLYRDLMTQPMTIYLDEYRKRQLRDDELAQPPSAAPARATVVGIAGDRFLINGQPTYPGRAWNNHRIEGLLFNTRMVQGLFDDLNPATASRWAYPDTGKWDPDRNTSEFVAAMPQWRAHGVLAFTLNLQGGSPEGYSGSQPWINSAFGTDGSLRADYLARLASILDEADRQGMVVILGYFYFGQEKRLEGEPAVLRAVDNITRWILGRGYTNLLIEVDNECNAKSYHPILQPGRVSELILRVKAAGANGRRLLVGTSFGGGRIPTDNVLAVSDFALVHGNGQGDPELIRKMARDTRARAGWHDMPLIFNEDDHFDFDRADNHLVAAIGENASWGYFDPGESNYRDGYQCPPVAWGIVTPRKQAFFGKIAEITGISAGRLH